MTLSIADEMQQSDIIISPRMVSLQVRDKPREETSFQLTWRETNHELYALNAVIKTVVETVEGRFHTTSPEQGLFMLFV